MTNAIIQIDEQNLSRPLETLQARFACSFRAKIVKVPESVCDLVLRVFRAGTDGYFDCPCNQDANGDWFCVILGTCFPTLGNAAYEIHAKDEDGNDTALGAGAVQVKPFSVLGEVIQGGGVILVAKIPDADGNLHRVEAVNIGTAEHPDWTWQIEHESSGQVEDSQPVGQVPDGTGALHQVRAVPDGDGGTVPRTRIVNGQ